MDAPVTAKPALLQALMSGDGYGLELIERVRERTSDTVRLHQGSVYPALRSLEREGLVESYEGVVTPERAGRPRRYYRITTDGVTVAQIHRHIVGSLFCLGDAWVATPLEEPHGENVRTSRREDLAEDTTGVETP